MQLSYRQETGVETLDRQRRDVREFLEGRDPGRAGMAGTSQHGSRGLREMDEEEAGHQGAAQGFLEWFLQQHVYPEQREHRQRDEEFKLVGNLVKRIMASVRNWNVYLFTGEAILVGSQAQDLHIQAESGSSTYDFLAPIHYRTNLILLGILYNQPRTDLHFLPSWLSLKAGVPVYRWENKLVVDYNKVTLRDILDGKTLETSLTEEDIKEINMRQRHLWYSGLDPFLVARKLHEFVTNVLAEERRKPATRIRNIRLNDFAQYPVVQLSLEVDGHTVSVNLVPAIRDKVDMSMDWPRQDLRWLSDWWDQEQGTERIKPTWNIMDIYNMRTDLVAKNQYWRLTFSQAETQLLRDLDLDGGHRQDVLQLLKQINLEKWVPSYGRVLTTYHLKMVLFWASDLNPETKSWATVLDALKTLLKVLEFCLEKRHLPSYFLPSLNFFAWKQRQELMTSLKNLALEALRLEVRLMRHNPQLYLQQSYNLAKPQSQKPFTQQEQELKEFRRQHQKDFEMFKTLKEIKQLGQGAVSISDAQQRHLGCALQLNILN